MVLLFECFHKIAYGKYSLGVNVQTICALTFFTSAVVADPGGGAHFEYFIEFAYSKYDIKSTLKTTKKRIKCA
jgi:hypothetical protein